jgi:hypothetical protein
MTRYSLNAHPASPYVCGECRRSCVIYQPRGRSVAATKLHCIHHRRYIHTVACRFARASNVLPLCFPSMVHCKPHGISLIMNGCTVVTGQLLAQPGHVISRLGIGYVVAPKQKLRTLSWDILFEPREAHLNAQYTRHIPKHL